MSDNQKLKKHIGEQKPLNQNPKPANNNQGNNNNDNSENTIKLQETQKRITPKK